MACSLEDLRRVGLQSEVVADGLRHGDLPLGGDVRRHGGITSCIRGNTLRGAHHDVKAPHAKCDAEAHSSKRRETYGYSQFGPSVRGAKSDKPRAPRPAP